MTYRELQTGPIVAAARRLAARIQERFPEAGLGGVAHELIGVAERCAAEAERLRRPNHTIRALVWFLWLGGAAGLVVVARALHYDGLDLTDASTLVQLTEPAMNIAVLVGLGVLTLARLETRWKRGRASAYLHELRSLIHIADMHQLTKDPYRGTGILAPTAHSPPARVTGAMLERYLDYCAEIAALTGKLAAALAQSCRDPEVTHAAADVEQLAAGLSQRIWQKIMTVDRAPADRLTAVSEQP